MQQPAREDHFPAEVAALVGDDSFEEVLLDARRVFDREQLLGETELNEGTLGLAVGPCREFFAGNAIREAGYVDDFLVGVQELGLSPWLVLGFDHQGGQAAMGGRQAGGEAGWAGANDDHVPVRELVEVRRLFLSDHIVIGHRNAARPDVSHARRSALISWPALSWRDDCAGFSRSSRSMSRTARVVFKTVSGLSEMLSMPHETRKRANSG